MPEGAPLLHHGLQAVQAEADEVVCLVDEDEPSELAEPVAAALLEGGLGELQHPVVEGVHKEAEDGTDHCRRAAEGFQVDDLDPVEEPIEFHRWVLVGEDLEVCEVVEDAPRDAVDEVVRVDVNVEVTDRRERPRPRLGPPLVDARRLVALLTPRMIWLR